MSANIHEPLKPCPFHNSDTCGCYDSVDIPTREWQKRPIEDALAAENARLEGSKRALTKLMTEHRELVEAVEALRHLLSPGGNYSICRTDKTPMHLGDQMIVGDAIAAIDKLLPTELA